MKKILVLSLLVLLFLGGCALKTTSPKETAPITLTLWHYYNGATKETFDSLVQTYNETIGQEQGVLVDAYSYSGVNELADAVFSSANKEVGSPDLPDIFSSYSDNVYRLNQLSVIAPLDTYFTENELAQFRTEFLSEGRFDQEGSLKIVPLAKSTELLYINATDFEPFAEANGVSLEDLTTWEGLAHTAKLYYDWTNEQTPERNDGKAFFGIDSFANFMMIASKQLGSEIYQPTAENTQFSLSKENAKRMWDLLYIPYLSGQYASIGRFRSDDTKSGDLIAYVGSTASANYFPSQVEESKDQAHPIACKVMPYPYFEGGDKVAVQQGAGMVVTKSDARRERAAVDFLKWFTAPEQNLQFTVATGYIPVYNSSLSRERMMDEISKPPQQSENDPTIQTVNVVCDILDEYTLYSCKPFPKSFEARKLQDCYMTQYLQQNRALLADGLAHGKDKKTLIKRLSSSSNFDKWYLDLMSELNALME